MSDITVAADAAPAQSSAPIAPPAVEPPKPVESDFADIKANGEARREAEKALEAEKKPATPRDAVKSAWDKSKAETKAKTEPKPETKTEAKTDAKEQPKESPKAEPVARAPDGKFAAKEAPQGAQQDAPAQTQLQDAKPVSEAPARFSDDAKAIWKDAPEPIRRETERAIRELTQGHEKYKADAESYQPFKPYEDFARQNGTTVLNALQSYIATEQELRTNPIKGAESLFTKLGISFRDLASAYLNQPVEAQQSAKDVEIAQLKQQIQQIQQGFSSFKGELETREAQQVIDSFKADHPRLDELRSDMGLFLQMGRATTLSEAYELADRLNPAPARQASTPAAASSAPVIDLVAQTQKGSKSIAGAPTPGSSPAGKQPSSSIREALKRAAARTG